MRQRPYCGGSVHDRDLGDGDSGGHGDYSFVFAFDKKHIPHTLPQHQRCTRAHIAIPSRNKSSPQVGSGQDEPHVRFVAGVELERVGTALRPGPKRLSFLRHLVRREIVPAIEQEMIVRVLAMEGLFDTSCVRSHMM